jgi:hypothetical protein
VVQTPATQKLKLLQKQSASHRSTPPLQAYEKIAKHALPIIAHEHHELWLSNFQHGLAISGSPDFPPINAGLRDQQTGS